jgi:hypothetical protein
MPPSRRRSARSIGEAGIAYGYYPRVHAELRSLGVRCAASEAGGPADAKSRAARVHAWKEEEDHPSRSSRCACSGPRQEELLCHSARQTLDGGHHLPLRTDEGFLHLAFSCWMSTRGGSSAGRWRSPPTHRELVVDALEMAVFGDVSRPQDSSTIPIAGLLSTRRFLSARGWRRLASYLRWEGRDRHWTTPSLGVFRVHAQMRARPWASLPHPRGSQEQRRLRVLGSVLQP